MKKLVFFFLLLCSLNAHAFFTAGAVAPFATASCPSGWLLTDGSAISRTTYAALFSKINTIYGVGNSTTTFNIPDYRGKFLRMIDGGTGRDPDLSTRTAMGTGVLPTNKVGSVQTDATQRFTGAVNSSRMQIDSASGAFYIISGSSRHDSGLSSNGRLNYNNSLVNRTSSEDRPKNAYVIYCIKY